MSEFMEFWWAKFLMELQVSAIVFLVIFVIFVSPLITKKIRQRFCKHEMFTENRACDAICADCGKNLGFIGNIRGKKGHREVR